MALAVASTASTDASASTSCVATAPSGVASGDLLIACVGKTVNAGANSLPSGWAALSTGAFRQRLPLGTSSIATLGSVGDSGMYYKVAGAGEPATYTWSAAAIAEWNIQILRLTGYRGYKPAGAFHMHYAFPTGKIPVRSVNTISIPQIPMSSIWCDSILLLAQFVQCAAATTITLSAPSGTLTTVANSAHVGMTQLVGYEIVDLTANPNLTQRQCTTDTASGSTGGFGLVLADPTSLAGIAIDRRRSLPPGYPRGKLVN